MTTNQHLAHAEQMDAEREAFAAWWAQCGRKLLGPARLTRRQMMLVEVALWRAWTRRGKTELH